MRTNNRDVIRKFIQGYENVQSHNGNLWISADGKRLMNYGTCLVHFSNGTFINNRTKYSVTTSKIQTWIGAELAYAHVPVKEVTGVPIGTSYLTDYVINIDDEIKEVN